MWHLWRLNVIRIFPKEDDAQVAVFHLKVARLFRFSFTMLSACLCANTDLPEGLVASDGNVKQ